MLNESLNVLLEIKLTLACLLFAVFQRFFIAFSLLPGKDSAILAHLNNAIVGIRYNGRKEGGGVKAATD